MDTYVIMKKKGQWYEDLNLPSGCEYDSMEEVLEGMKFYEFDINNIIEAGYEIVIKKI
jgi:hypothetical protein